jgi:hypothetical protein
MLAGLGLCVLMFVLLLRRQSGVSITKGLQVDESDERRETYRVSSNKTSLDKQDTCRKSRSSLGGTAAQRCFHWTWEYEWSRSTAENTLMCAKICGEAVTIELAESKDKEERAH